MSIYNSDAENSTFSLFQNNESSIPTKLSKSSSRASALGVSSGQYIIDAPNVVGLGRIEAISLLTNAGFDYTILYVTNSATSENNDVVASQSMSDLIVVISVYQYVQSYIFSLPSSSANYLAIGAEPNSDVIGWQISLGQSTPQELIDIINEGFSNLNGKTFKYTGTGTIVDNEPMLITHTGGFDASYLAGSATCRLEIITLLRQQHPEGLVINTGYLTLFP